MRDAVLDACKSADALIMAAAVSDFRPAEAAVQKIKKGDAGLSLDLVKNADFLLEVPDDVVKVGFAAETQDLLENAQKKLVEKRLDLNVRQRRLGLRRGLRGRHEPCDDPRPRRWPRRRASDAQVRRRSAHPRPPRADPQAASRVDTNFTHFTTVITNAMRFCNGDHQNHRRP